MQLLQLLLLLLLAHDHFGFCLTRQNVSDEKCSDRLLKFFSKQQNLSHSAEKRYHLTVKEKLTSLESNHVTNENQMVEYKGKVDSYACHLGVHASQFILCSSIYS